METERSERALEPDDGRTYWLDKPENVQKVVWSVYGVCAFLFAIDFLVEKHGDGPFEIVHWYGFYGLYGFVACVALVLAAKQLRRILMRPEDYYDR
jgi:hypothetical protein